MLQQLPWALAFYGLGGWGWVFWGISSRVSVSFWVTGLSATLLTIPGLTIVGPATPAVAHGI
jgi:hypothetical protein